MICTLCSSDLHQKVDEVFFDCSSCGALVMDRKNWLTSDQEMAHYQTHNNDVFDIRYQKFVSPITDFVLANFNKDHIGLDFGSGTGPVISKVLQDQNFKIFQYDPFFAPDKSVLEKQYDYILSCEVIEHFCNPKKEFELLESMLITNGYLVCMTLIYTDEIDFESWYYRKDPTHVFIYRAATFDYIANRYGFRVAQITQRLVVLRKN